jgi:hypothetical protein
LSDDFRKMAAREIDEFKRELRMRGDPRKPGSTVRLSIPIHGNRPLKLGLLRHLAKLAEIPDGELG